MVKLGPKKGLAQFRSESRTARPHHAVSIHNLRTVAPRYGELLALLVYLTWLLHRGLGFKSLVVPWRKIYHSQRGTNMYVDAPLLVHVS